MIDPRPAVASAMAALDDLADRPLAEHVEAFERVHAALGEALADPADAAPSTVSPVASFTA